MERPILFNTEMVKAILEGRKTQTRRVARDISEMTFENGLDRKPYIGNFTRFEKTAKRKWGWVTHQNVWLYNLQTAVDGSKAYMLKPPCQTGDILWMRETWWKYGDEYLYRADGDEEVSACSTPTGGYPSECRNYPGCEGCTRNNWKIPWKSSIHMPRTAARIFLKVKNVRVERLQDITEDDAKAEGATAYGPNNCSGTSARIAFAEIWDKTTTEYEWRKNPWVFVVEFEVINK